MTNHKKNDHQKSRGGRPPKYDFSDLARGRVIFLTGHRAMMAARVWASRHGIKITAEKICGEYYKSPEAKYLVRPLHKE